MIDFLIKYTTIKSLLRGWIPMVRPLISSVSISVGTRILRTQWTPELAQDVSAFHSFDAEFLLRGILNEEIRIIGNSYKQSKQVKSIAKKRRYKDRKLYIHEIEEWSGTKLDES